MISLVVWKILSQQNLISLEEKIQSLPQHFKILPFHFKAVLTLTVIEKHCNIDRLLNHLIIPNPQCSVGNILRASVRTVVKFYGVEGEIQYISIYK